MRVIRSLDEVEQLRSWWSSLPGHRDSDIDVYLTVCRHSPDVLAPYILVLSRNNEPETILIGRIMHGRFDCRIGYLSVFRSVVRRITFSYGGLRGNACPENSAILVRQIVKSLVTGEADLALLDHIEKSSPLFDCAQHIPGVLFRDYLPSFQPHWIMELPNCVEQLYLNLSYNQRAHFRKTSRRLERAFPGQVKLIRFGEPANLDHALQNVEEVAAKTYQRKLGVGFTNSAAQREFLKTQAELGWLWIYVLYIADKPVAFWIGAIYQQRFFSDFTGYDPQYTNHAPGTYLLSKMLEEFCSDGIVALDFGFGDNAYKERISSIARQEATLHLFAPTLKGLKLSAMRVFTSAIHEALKGTLQRMNLVQNTKKAWRRVAVARKKAA